MWQFEFVFKRWHWQGWYLCYIVIPILDIWGQIPNNPYTCLNPWMYCSHLEKGHVLSIFIPITCQYNVIWSCWLWHVFGAFTLSGRSLPYKWCHNIYQLTFFFSSYWILILDIGFKFWIIFRKCELKRILTIPWFKFTVYPMMEAFIAFGKYNVIGNRVGKQGLQIL